jgi:hypothetical protein
MDNQATKTIKAYLTPQQVIFQLVEPHNHRVNAAKRALSKPSKTDSLAPSAPQIASSPFSVGQTCPSSARLHHPPPALAHYTRQVGISNDGRTLQFQSLPSSATGDQSHHLQRFGHADLMGPHGLDAWYLGPSKDHYHCHHYYVPETRGYRISGSTDLFPQHGQELSYSHYSHIRDLSLELQENLLTVECKAKTLKVLKLLVQHLDAYISGTPPPLCQNKGCKMENRGCLPT